MVNSFTVDRLTPGEEYARAVYASVHAMPGKCATADQVEALARCDRYRLTQFLVRCDGCRFIASAQDVKHIVEALEKSGDHVRDVSLYAPVSPAPARWKR
jgi:hypothetical protein